MRYYTKKWFQLCQECAPDDPRVQMPPREYAAIQREQGIADVLWAKLNFHDAQLLEICMKGNALHLWMEDMGWGYDHLILKNPTVLQWEEPLTELVWIYEELYRTPVGYELHVLFQDWRGPRLAELMVQCEDILIKAGE